LTPGDDGTVSGYKTNLAASASPTAASHRGDAVMPISPPFCASPKVLMRRFLRRSGCRGRFRTWRVSAAQDNPRPLRPTLDLDPSLPRIPTAREGLRVARPTWVIDAPAIPRSAVTRDQPDGPLSAPVPHQHGVAVGRPGNRIPPSGLQPLRSIRSAIRTRGFSACCLRPRSPLGGGQHLSWRR